ncbi:MAG: hypothetical protein ACR2OC_12230 [Solirubrobacterales bacterium]
MRTRRSAALLRRISGAMLIAVFAAMPAVARRPPGSARLPGTGKPNAGEAALWDPAAADPTAPPAFESVLDATGVPSIAHWVRVS